jgi:Cupredoxin-like domain
MLRNCLATACGLLLTATALADPPTYTPTNADGRVEVILKDHRFTPSEIHVPANKRTELLIKNEDATADEFDSAALRVEKVVAGHAEGVVRLRALDPGRYPFMGEFNASTAQGVVVAE